MTRLALLRLPRQLLGLLGRGLRRWLELLAENPPLSRDCTPIDWPPPVADDRSPGPEKAPGFHVFHPSL